MPGKVEARDHAEKVGPRVPLGLYHEMMGSVGAAKMWPDPPRQNYILETIKQKLDRRKREHPMSSAPAKDRG